MNANEYGLRLRCITVSPNMFELSTMDEDMKDEDTTYFMAVSGTEL